MTTPLEILPSVEPTDGIYFSGPDGKYWRRVASAGWTPFTQENIKMYLRARGVSDRTVEKEIVSPMDLALLRIQEERSVGYAGPLAGHRCGPRKVNGNNILITSEPNIIAPEPGEFPVIEALLAGMFTNLDQRHFLLGWMKYGYESLAYGYYRPGQVVAIAGDKDSGKSALQMLLLTPLFGGRKADPMRYMMGRTEFNADLAGAEHLMIEDAASSTKIETRRHFGSVAKQFAVNMTQSIHGKGIVARDLDPMWRVSVTLNKEPENICVLPPLDDSLEDKIALLMADKAPMPMPVRTLEQKRAFAEAIRAELPAFCAFLLEWEPPEAMKDDRFGVRAYHHKEMLVALQDIAPEIKLAALMDSDPLMFQNGTEEIISAEEIEQRLVSGDNRFAASRLLYWQGACASLLSKLASHPDFKDRVRKAEHRAGNSRKWVIQPPTRGIAPKG